MSPPPQAPSTAPGAAADAPPPNMRLLQTPPSADSPPPAQAVQTPPRRRRTLAPFVILLAVLGGGGWFGWDWWENGRFMVTTDDAYVKADMSAIAAKIPGYIVALSVRDNQMVKAGDELARIDEGDYRLAVNAAEGKIASQAATLARIDSQRAAQSAVVAQTRSQLAVTQADAQRTEAALVRAARLASREFASQAVYDQARADRERNLAQIAQAETAITAAEAQVSVLQAQRIEAERLQGELQTALARAQRDLSFTIIRAPFDGIVGNRVIQLGQYVQPGGRLLSLINPATVYIEANVKESQLTHLAPGQSATLKLDGFPTRTFTGRIESVAPASGALFSLLPPENATGNFTKIVQRIPIRIALDAPTLAEKLLRPGLSVTVGVRIAFETAPARLGQIDGGQTP